jgi:transposase
MHGDVLIMDNARFHKKHAIELLLNEFQCTVIFLPPYSPELNPIEKKWGNLKNWLRKKCFKRMIIEKQVGLYFKRKIQRV